MRDDCLKLTDNILENFQATPSTGKGRKTMLTKKLIFAAIFVFMFATEGVLAGGDVARGKELSVDCVDCHGEDGKGDEFTPAIAGLKESYQVEQLQAFKSGERTDEDDMMQMYAEDLSEQDMQDLAAYYASLPAE